MDRDDLDSERRERGHAGRIDPAAHGDAPHPGRRRPPGDSEGRLPECRLGVDPAFAGDHQVGPAELRVEVDLTGDEIDARLEGEASEPVGQAEQGEADPSGRPGTGGVAFVPAGDRLEQVGIAGEPFVEGRDVRR